MDKQLHKIARKACSKVYHDNIDLGTTEFQTSHVEYNGDLIQVIAIAGTNEARDWGENFKLWSTKGIKKAAVDAAREVSKNVYLSGRKLLICGHSKAGATAIAYKRLFGANWCIAFSPARSLRYWADRVMENTTIFIDPDDPVPKFGALSFGHPICTVVESQENHFGLCVGDHSMDQWEEFLA
jgi:hypothetical protein